MRFSNWKQILALTVAWGITLYAVDLTKRPRAIRDLFERTETLASPKRERPHVSMWFNHLCCSGCLSGVEAALATVPGLGKPEIQLDERLLSPSEADQITQPERIYSSRVDVDVTDVASLDFVALDEALRRAGLPPEHMEWSGMLHFRLEAKLPHVCCSLCARSLSEGMDVAKALRGVGHFSWLDSVSVNKEKKTITAHARLDATVDAIELLLALNHLGFAPSSLRVLGGPET
jgi:hypothetical protein